MRPVKIKQCVFWLETSLFWRSPAAVKSAALRLWCEISGPQLWDRRSPVSHWCGACFSPSACTDRRSLVSVKEVPPGCQRRGVPLIFRHQLLNPLIQNAERGGNTNWSHVPYRGQRAELYQISCLRNRSNRMRFVRLGTPTVQLHNVYFHWMVEGHRAEAHDQQHQWSWGGQQSSIYTSLCRGAIYKTPMFPWYTFNSCGHVQYGKIWQGRTALLFIYFGALIELYHNFELCMKVNLGQIQIILLI